MKKIKKKELKKIELKINDKKGFTLWITEEVNGRQIKHWLIDASCFRRDGRLRLGTPQDHYRYEAVLDKKNNCIKLIDKSRTDV